MNGLELRAIRRFNKISQKKLAKHFGYKTPESILEIEQDYRKSEEPPLFIKNLSNLIAYDLTAPDKSATLIENIPKKYFKIYIPRDPLKFYNEPL